MDKKRQQELRMLGITISYYRRAKGYTQAQLAREIHVSRTHISNIEAPNAKTSVSITLTVWFFVKRYYDNYYRNSLEVYYG